MKKSFIILLIVIIVGGTIMSITALTTISGEIQSQPLNDNFSAIANTFNLWLSENKDFKILKNGKINLPSDFSTIYFEIYKKNKYDYSHNVTPYNQYDWSTATEVFISIYNTTSTDGTDYTQPISLNRFLTNLDGAVYGAETDFILTFMDNMYAYTGGGTSYSATNKNINILFRSKSTSGFTWITRIQRPGIETSSWISDSGVYKTTQVVTYTINDVIDFVNLDTNDMPFPYIKVGTLGECQSTKGTFYQSGADVWCNPLDTSIISDINLQFNTVMIDIAESNDVKIMFENIGFVTGTYDFDGSSINTEFYFFNTKFYRGLQDAFSINGAYKVYIFDSIAAYGSKDGFNYHSTDTDSLAVEINCKSYGNGQYKLDGGNTTTHSNNGSTAHDGMYILRIGSKYWDCEGPIVADVNNCYSISIGCSANGILSTSTGVNACFYLDNTGSSLPYNNKYVIECNGNGTNVEYGIYGTEETYYMSFEGLNVFNNDINTIDWEDIN